MLSVENVPASVETELETGGLACPSCAGVLGPWGHARERPLRRGRAEERVRPRRSCCRSCGVTHVLLPDTTLLRRRDHVEVIGAALEARVAGDGYRVIARTLGRDRSTVRNWLRSFRSLAERVRAHFTALAYAFDSDLLPIAPAGDALGDAVAAIGIAVRAAVQRFGPSTPWPLASRLSNGALLSNTICHLPRAS
ncbi:MAG: helix-turn-helix domain-containing protein [Acidimicrobiales bacterium]